MSKKVITRRYRVKDILDDYFSGLPIKDIAEKYNITSQTVLKQLRRITAIMEEYTPEELEALREQKANLIDATQFKIIQEMNKEDKIRRASLKDLAFSFEKLYNANRLERGQSTENVAIKQERFVEIVKDLAKDKNEDLEQI